MGPPPPPENGWCFSWSPLKPQNRGYPHTRRNMDSGHKSFHLLKDDVWLESMMLNQPVPNSNNTTSPRPMPFGPRGSGTRTHPLPDTSARARRRALASACGAMGPGPETSEWSPTRPLTPLVGRFASPTKIDKKELGPSVPFSPRFWGRVPKIDCRRKKR